MVMPLETGRGDDRSIELQAAFGAVERQLIALIPAETDHQEAERRLSALRQQLEILAGIPDEPWTYRRSLRMEMQRSPRPPVEVVMNGKVIRDMHPLDQIRKDYFLTLGKSVRSAQDADSTAGDFAALDRFTECAEPLLSHFAHYELIRLHEMEQHPSPAAEFRHRLHVVFYSPPSDASVRPVIGAIHQLVEQPELIADEALRYDQLNALLQKLIERWEARTAWEPRSALRVQNDVDLSIQVVTKALQQMESQRDAASVSAEEFRGRRRFVTAALISPLRDYREQVLAHRLKSEPGPPTGHEDPDDLPLMVPADSPTGGDAGGIATN
jgi:hypothetical protein